MSNELTCTYKLPDGSLCGREAQRRFVCDRADFEAKGEQLECYFDSDHAVPATLDLQNAGYTWKEYMIPPYVTCCDVIEGPPKPRPSCQIVLAIHPKHARAILSGKKRIEFRRVGWGLNDPAGIHGVFLYATAPISMVVGHYATSMGDYGKESIGRLRARFRAVRGTGLTIQEFDEYFAGKDEGFYSYVYEPKKFAKPFDLSDFGRDKFNGVARLYQAPKRPPQNWARLIADNPELCNTTCEHWCECDRMDLRDA